MHTIQLEELWDQRETQLDTNKRLSTQFFEFEKEIRKVKRMIKTLICCVV